MLIAEDDYITAKLYKIIFAQDEIDLCLDGDSCVMAYDGSHDIIILDIKMPRKNGLKVIEFLKGVNNKIPVVVVTAMTLTDEVRKATKEFLVIRKPMDIITLRAKLIEYLKERHV